jgi:hypothetical protein
MTADQPPFQAHVGLLRFFLAQREDIVESIGKILNSQRKPAAYLQDRSALSRDFENCFFARGQHAQELCGRLETAHRASGFQPRQVQHVYNDLIHPAEIVVRGFHCWQQTRWPGSSGRICFAHALFSLYVTRCLAFLSLRIWDEDTGGAGGRLAEIQNLLDELRTGAPAGQPVFVRDARWLIPLAQSLITDELTPYLNVARQVTETLPNADALETWKAHVRMLGGHLTSQIRYYCTKDSLSIGDHSVVLRTRTSNALDFALLVQGLVELLRAYDRAVKDDDQGTRHGIAGAILQGISPDPGLFLNRVDMLSAYTMIEHAFIGTDSGGNIAYTPLGEWYVRALREYSALIDRLASPLREDGPRFRPVHGCVSPYGVMFGIPSNLIEHMALKTMEHDAETRFSIEDVFDDTHGETSAARLAWVNGWRKLPHIAPEVRRQYEYPQQFAEEICTRIEQELGRHDSGISKSGRIYIGAGSDSEIPELPARYFVSSDRQIVAAYKAEFCDQGRLLRDRQEGHFLVSWETPGGWMAIRKSVLAEVLAAGLDARITGLPDDAAQILGLMCTGLLNRSQASQESTHLP